MISDTSIGIMSLLTLVGAPPVISLSRVSNATSLGNKLGKNSSSRLLSRLLKLSEFEEDSRVSSLGAVDSLASDQDDAIDSDEEALFPVDSTPVSFMSVETVLSAPVVLGLDSALDVSSFLTSKGVLRGDEGFTNDFERVELLAMEESLPSGVQLFSLTLIIGPRDACVTDDTSLFWSPKEDELVVALLTCADTVALLLEGVPIVIIIFRRAEGARVAKDLGTLSAGRSNIGFLPPSIFNCSSEDSV